jgi:hypothetical protein
MAPLSDRELLEKIDTNVNSIMGAFPKGNDGRPDYLGHVIYHRMRKDEQEDNRKSKSQVKSNIVSWAVIGIITAIISYVLNNPGIIIGYLGK